MNARNFLVLGVMLPLVGCNLLESSRLGSTGGRHRSRPGLLQGITTDAPARPGLFARKGITDHAEPAIPTPLDTKAFEISERLSPAPLPNLEARNDDVAPDLPLAKMPEPIEIKVELPKPMPAAPVKVATKTEVVTKSGVKHGVEGGFKSIAGQVQQYRNTWRLRYAEVGQDDPHGGSVLLEGDLGDIRDGQTVRVRGFLIPAADRRDSARYRVQAIEVLD